MAQNIVLIGMRASGKSAIGRKIAEQLSYNFFDLDEVLTSKLNKSIAQTVKDGGWELFREEEGKICDLISREKNAIISTGGGVILREENVENLKRNGVIVLLYCDIEVLKNRRNSQKNDRENRPLLKAANVKGEVEQVWEERKEKYEKAADFTFDVSDESLDKRSDLKSKAHKIIALLRENGAIN